MQSQVLATEDAIGAQPTYEGRRNSQLVSFEQMTWRTYRPKAASRLICRVDWKISFLSIFIRLTLA
jgi:hypothetical protein